MAAVDETKRNSVKQGKTREGKLQDKRFHDEDDIAGNVPDEVPIEVNLGSQGLQNQSENIHIPHKKPREESLSEVQKQKNRCLNQSRVICENAFAGVKCYNAVNMVYRNRIEDFDNHLMLISTGSWNFGSPEQVRI